MQCGAVSPDELSGVIRIMKRKIDTVVLIAIITTVSMTAFAQSRKVEKAKDSVCGLMVDKDHAFSVKYNAETFYFCSRADMEKFQKEPKKYARKK